MCLTRRGRSALNGSRCSYKFKFLSLARDFPPRSYSPLFAAIGAYAGAGVLLGPPEYPLPLSIRMFEFATEQNEWEIVFAMGILLSFAASVVLLVYYGLTAI